MTSGFESNVALKVTRRNSSCAGLSAGHSDSRGNATGAPRKPFGQRRNQCVLLVLAPQLPEPEAGQHRTP